jgi:hypothetical protein
VCKAVLALMDVGTPLSSDRRAVGDHRPASAAPAATYRSPGDRPSPGGGGHPRAAADRHAVARHTGRLSALADRLQPGSPLTAGRDLGPGADCRAGRVRAAGCVRRGVAAARQHDRARPLAALGRSLGESSTKRQGRTDGTGKPLVVGLTPGQASERSQVWPLLPGVRGPQFRGLVLRLLGVAWIMSDWRPTVAAALPVRPHPARRSCSSPWVQFSTRPGGGGYGSLGQGAHDPGGSGPTPSPTHG